MRTEIKRSESTIYLCEKCGFGSENKEKIEIHERYCTVNKEREKYLGSYIFSKECGYARVLNVRFSSFYGYNVATVMSLSEGVEDTIALSDVSYKVDTKKEIDKAVEEMKKECCDRIDANYAKSKKAIE